MIQPKNGESLCWATTRSCFRRQGIRTVALAMVGRLCQLPPLHSLANCRRDPPLDGEACNRLAGVQNRIQSDDTPEHFWPGRRPDQA